MITKNILDEVFERSFARGNYLGQMDKLDGQGVIDRRKIFVCLIRLMEACDKLEERIEKLENDSNEPRQKTSRSLQPDKH